MKEQFLKAVQQKHFFDKHQYVLLAVSGGIDSMNLLYLLDTYQKELGISIGLAHVHYGQRAEADQEASYLEKIAKKRDIPFHLAYFKTKFSEKTARDFRYHFFRNLMEKYGYTALVTAHHADDQAETVLMRLIRGSRLLHLSSIKERQAFAGGELIRPLLTFPKSELAEIFHFEDSSNRSDKYFRNRVRRTYLPQLAQENPRLSRHLCDLAREVSDVKSALAYFTQDINYRQLDKFRAYPQSVQTFFLQDYLNQFPDLQMGKSQFKAILHLLNSKKNQIFPLKSDYELLIDYKKFYIRKINLKTDDQKQQIVLESGNTAEYAGYQFGFNQELVGAEQVLALPTSNNLLLRHRQPGDVILVKGHHKKIRRLFIDNKVDIDKRESALIVEQAGQVLAILGIAVSDLSKSPKSDTIGASLYIKKIKMEEVSC